jgi:hypothetical protein
MADLTLIRKVRDNDDYRPDGVRQSLATRTRLEQTNETVIKRVGTRTNRSFQHLLYKRFIYDGAFRNRLYRICSKTELTRDDGGVAKKQGDWAELIVEKILRDIGVPAINTVHRGPVDFRTPLRVNNQYDMRTRFFDFIEVKYQRTRDYNHAMTSPYQETFLIFTVSKVSDSDQARVDIKIRHDVEHNLEHRHIVLAVQNHNGRLSHNIPPLRWPRRFLTIQDQQAIDEHRRARMLRRTGSFTPLPRQTIFRTRSIN